MIIIINIFQKLLAMTVLFKAKEAEQTFITTSYQSTGPPSRLLHFKAQQILLWYPRQTIKRVICFIFEMLHFNV